MVKYSVRYHNLLLSHVTFGRGAEEVGRKRRKRSQAGFLPGDGVPLLWNSLCEMESKVKEGRRRRRRKRKRKRPPARPPAFFESWDIVARIFSPFFSFCLSAAQHEAVRECISHCGHLHHVSHHHHYHRYTAGNRKTYILTSRVDQRRWPFRLRYLVHVSHYRYTTVSVLLQPRPEWTGFQ